MPTAIAYRRAPLVDPALVPLSDAAVHADGLQKQLTELALGLVDLNRMSPLDAALATKLGGYTETPPFPDVEAAAGLLPNEPERFAALLRAASMLAAMSRDKHAMLRVLGGMRAFLAALGEKFMAEVYWKKALEGGYDDPDAIVERFRRLKEAAQTPAAP